MCTTQDGSRVPFKVKKTTVFDKLFRAYCQKKALDQATLVFMDVEGKRILPHQTPAEVCPHNPKQSIPFIFVQLWSMWYECTLHPRTYTALQCANACLCAQFKMEDGDNIEVGSHLCLMICSAVVLSPDFSHHAHL